MEKVGFELCRSLGSRKVEKAERAFRGLRDKMGYVMQVGGRGNGKGWKGWQVNLEKQQRPAGTRP